ncbi:MAG: hypothetical protein AAFP13_11005 [Pseudomonadota bacterium]
MSDRRAIATGRARATAAAAACLALLAAGSTAQEAQEAEDAPLSAIDWLGDVPMEPALDDPFRALEAPVAESGAVPSVEAAPLEDGGGSGTGVISTAVSGLPSRLWQGATEAEIAAGFDAIPTEALLPVQQMRQRLLLAAAAPPAGTDEAAFLVLRVDALVALGAVPAALSLLEEAGETLLRDGRVFRRYADLSLLTGREDAACARLRGEAALSDDIALRVFCLARTSDWNAAAVALNTAAVLGDVAPETAELLTQFLEPEFADGTAPPLPPGPVTPLLMRLREAVGAPLASADLPPAFAVSDLRADMGWKAQLDAAERLARTGALPPAQLAALYRARVPAASGGVWDRAEAVRRISEALETGAALDAPLEAGRAALAAAGLEAQLAAMVADALRQRDAGGPARQRLLLLSPFYEAATAAEGLPAEVARGRVVSASANSALEEAIAEAFRPGREIDPPVSLGLALLDALATIEAARTGASIELTRALALLRAVGLEDIARQSALHLLLMQADA